MVANRQSKMYTKQFYWIHVKAENNKSNIQKQSAESIRCIVFQVSQSIQALIQHNISSSFD